MEAISCLFETYGVNTHAAPPRMFDSALKKKSLFPNVRSNFWAQNTISGSDLLSSGIISFPFSVNLAACDIFFLVDYVLERYEKKAYPKEYKENFPPVVVPRAIGWNVMRNMRNWNTWKLSPQINNYGESRIVTLWYVLDTYISADTLGTTYLLPCYRRVHESKLSLNLVLVASPWTKGMITSNQVLLGLYLYHCNFSVNLGNRTKVFQIHFGFFSFGGF